MNYLLPLELPSGSIVAKTKGRQLPAIIIKDVVIMKKGEIFEGTVEYVDFPNKGIVPVEDKKVVIKNTIPGQKVRFMINKLRKGKPEARILEVLEKSPIETVDTCPHFGMCGGCTYHSVAYDKQLELKENQIRSIIAGVCEAGYTFETIKGSPMPYQYRNKMEFSFGDEYKDGPLALGLHKRASMYDVVTTHSCQLVHPDYNRILSATLEYFKKLNIPYYHKMSHEGYLRHLLVRRAVKTGEILVALVTSGQASPNLTDWVEELKKLELEGNLTGVLHILNDSVADVVRSDETTILYGQDYFYEELLGLKFKITPFSFFQTNSLGAEVLYSTAREYVGDTKDKVIFDLYSGTGTIAQMLAPVARRVVGVEIIEEAVEAAKENAKLNGLSNCEFIAGDVLKVIDDLVDKPDIIVLDPPRDGIHPKALDKIIDFGVDRIVYISCKPTSLARDLEVLLSRGYKLERVCPIDMFPGSYHCETCVLLSK